MNFRNGTEYIAVSGGFVEIRQHKVSVIVQTAETASEIDVERAKLARQRAQSHLEDQDNSDINRAKRALARAENRLRVAELKGLETNFSFQTFLCCIIVTISIILCLFNVQYSTEI